MMPIPLTISETAATPASSACKVDAVSDAASAISVMEIFKNRLDRPLRSDGGLRAVSSLRIARARYTSLSEKKRAALEVPIANERVARSNAARLRVPVVIAATAWLRNVTIGTARGIESALAGESVSRARVWQSFRGLKVDFDLFISVVAPGLVTNRMLRTLLNRRLLGAISPSFYPGFTFHLTERTMPAMRRIREAGLRQVFAPSAYTCREAVP